MANQELIVSRVWATGLFGLMGFVANAAAAGIDFDFKDPKGANSILFLLDSVVEPIAGVASGITGTVNFDPAQPKALSGAISIDAKKLHIENKGMKDTVQDQDWLDVSKNPIIQFKFKEVKEAKPVKDNMWELQVAGELALKGVVKPLAVTVKAHYLKEGLGKRQGGQAGDLLILRSQFSIKRKDFGIKSDMNGEVVAEEIELRVSIVGTAKK